MFLTLKFLTCLLYSVCIHVLKLANRFISTFLKKTSLNLSNKLLLNGISSLFSFAVQRGSINHVIYEDGDSSPLETKLSC